MSKRAEYSGVAVEPAGMAETPEWIGDYKVIKELGRGAMGVVYLAEHPSLGRQMALKVMARELSMDPAFLERFRREGQAAAKLRHPNIVQVFDFAQRDGQHFIAMEYLGAKTVKDLLDESGHLTVERACALMDDLLSALALAHGKDIIHRDIKPANIMLTDEGAAALTDFSIAHMKETSKLTQTGAIVGTPEYMAPEQFDGHWDARSDLYSAGLVFYELLTGTSPFRANTISEVMRKQLFKVPDPPCLLETDVPEPLSRVVSKVLEKEPDARYQTAGEMRLAVKAALSETPAALEAPRTQTAPPPETLKTEAATPPGIPTAATAPPPETPEAETSAPETLKTETASAPETPRAEAPAPPPLPAVVQATALTEATLTGAPKEVTASPAVTEPEPLAPLRKKSSTLSPSPSEPETAVNQPKAAPEPPPVPPVTEPAPTTTPAPPASESTNVLAPATASTPPSSPPAPLREQEISRRRRSDRTRNAGRAGSLACIILAVVLWFRLDLGNSDPKPSPSATPKAAVSPTHASPAPSSPPPEPVYTPPVDPEDNDDPPIDEPDPDYPPGDIEQGPEFPMSGVISPGRTVGDVALGTGKEKVKSLWGPPDKGASANGMTRWDYAGTGDAAQCAVMFSAKGVVEMIAIGDSRFSVAGDPNCKVGATYDTIMDSFYEPTQSSPQYLYYKNEGVFFSFKDYVCDGILVFGRGRDLGNLRSLRAMNALR